MANNSEETREETARKAVTEGLMDPATIQLLSAAGDAAKRSRTPSPFARTRVGQQKSNTNEGSGTSTNDNKVDDKKDDKEQKPSG